MLGIPFVYDLITDLLRAKLNNYLWPGSVTNLACCVGGVLAVRLADVGYLQSLRSKFLQFEELFSFLDGKYLVSN